jgi:hypothetical protein
MRKYLYLIVATFFSCASCSQHACSKSTEISERNEMSTAAQNYITAFRRNEDFQRPITGLIINQKIDKRGIETLGRELATGTPQVREKIVYLLLEIDLQANSERHKHGVLRDQDILKLLSTSGLAKNDLGLNAAASILRNYSEQKTLASYSEHYTKALEYSTNSELLLLIAKAKPIEARAAIEHLNVSPDWQDEESVKIASAALGNTTYEGKYIQAAKEAGDGESLAIALQYLGLIGTQRSLKTVASYLRTPLKISREGSFERTVRMDALEALAYNFPDQSFLYPNNINSPEDYAAAEQFCTAKFGAIFDSAVPNFPADRIFPIPLPKN